MGSTRKATSGPHDAIGLLISDHREVKTLFEEYDKLAETKAEASDRQALAETICDMLTVHATIEEEIFYPAARKATQDDDLLDEAQVEHDAAKDWLRRSRTWTPTTNSMTPR